MTNFEWVLTPSKYDERSRPLALELNQWDTAVRLSGRFGYAPPETGGMTRDAVRCFAQALRAAAESDLPEADGEWLGRLIGFLDGDARGGFTQARRWKRDR